MMKLFILYIICLTGGQTQINTGNENSSKVRIMGGYNAPSGKFPWHVYISIQCGNSKKFACGGSLISSTWVITAAHCLTNVKTITMKIGGISTDFQHPEKASKVLTAQSFIMHKRFKKSNKELNDIALIKLSKSVEENELIKYIRLPILSAKYLENTTALVSGSGRAETGKKIEILKYTKVNIIANSKCEKVYKKYFNKDHIICCKGNTTETACNGDSGGPLISFEDDSIPTLIGLVSLGSQRYGCTNKLPAVYTKVSSYLKWIHKHTNIKIRSHKRRKNFLG